MDEMHLKKAKLEASLRALGRVAVAFSSGVDSTFLLAVARDVLGDGALAVTARSSAFPEREAEEAAAFCASRGIRQLFVDTDPLSVPGFRENPPERCYICKKYIFSRMIGAAAELGFGQVAEGSNVDDVGDYRPGLAAIAELGVLSPLRAAGLRKAEIRELSRELGLPTWDKPSYACLATRFVYGETITAEKLRMVELAERRLLDLGLRQVRVRVHGDVARIEVLPEDFARLAEPETAASLNAFLRGLGFGYAALDLGGYVTGSMNRTLET
ncbi:MAG: ATP-dependent sacrificial sulfur transferase LarE [Oscillospiraceae bacterium]|nr:ATP-dependent sacrificial sulfur transferase LarE [Oscillospiraceae bacterium]